MNAQEMKHLVVRYYDEVWSQGRLAFVDEHMSADYENHDPATPARTVVGREAFKALAAGYREAFPDLRFEIAEQFVDGDTVVSRWHASGTQRGALMGLPPSGGRASGIEGITITAFEAGRIRRDRIVWDTLGLLRSLGALPA